MKMYDYIFCKLYFLARYFLNVCLIVCFSLFAISTNAAEFDSVGNTGIRVNAGIDFSNYMQVFVALIAVLIIIFILSVILKKTQILQRKNSGLIKIIAGISLSNKDRLLLIQVGEEQILISATLGRINKIHQLTTMVESNIDLSPSTPEEKSSFKSFLHSINSRQGE